jgi:hypothetical protein
MKEEMGERPQQKFSLARARKCEYHTAIVESIVQQLGELGIAMHADVIYGAGLTWFQESVHWPHIRTMVEEAVGERLLSVNRWAPSLDMVQILAQPQAIMCGHGSNEPEAGWVLPGFCQGALHDREQERLVAIKSGYDAPIAVLGAQATRGELGSGNDGN